MAFRARYDYERVEDFTPLKIPEGHQNSVLVVSVSGGKDSTALLLRLIESELPFRAVFADTGWEAPETYAYLDFLREHLGIAIDVVRSAGMESLIRERGMFPNRMNRWCTRELKVEPLLRYHQQIQDTEQTDTISIVGVRREESAARADLPVFGWDEAWNGYVWRPFALYGVDDILRIHQRHKIPVNPLYYAGHERVGCNPCIFADKETIKLTAEQYPEQIKVISKMEEDLSARRQTKATYFMSRQVHQYVERTEWVHQGRFRHPTGRKAPEQPPPPDGAAMPGEWRILKTPTFSAMNIAEVVEWAKARSDNRRVKVVQDKPTGGCYRWGLCEPQPAAETPVFLPESEPANVGE